MNEQKNNKRITKVILIIMGLASVLLLTINFIPIFVIDDGIEGRFSDEKFSDSETFVNRSNPTKNYFDSYELYIGEFTELYIYFNLESIPKKTDELYFFIGHFYFDVESAVDDIEINIIFTESNWTASNITWNNKPKHEEIITTLNIRDIVQYIYAGKFHLHKTVNLTELIKEEEIKEFSICLNITENNEKLNASAEVSGFYIVWSYKELILSYTPIISTFILILLLLGIIYFLRKDLFICQECSTKRTLEDKYCRSCGSPIKENILIKSRDYQLILIILFIFIFLETSIISILFSITTGPLILFPGLIILLWALFCFKQIKKQINKFKKLNNNLKQA